MDDFAMVKLAAVDFAAAGLPMDEIAANSDGGER